MSRRELGEAVGYEGDSAYQTVYEWETGRRSIPSELMPDIAGLLGVPICALYGVEEGHDQEREPAADWVRRLVEGLAQHPERIEINLFKEGGSRGAVAASGRALADEAFEPPPGLRFMQAFLAEGRWREMPETERDQWRELAEAIRREEGAANGPGSSQPHGRGYP